MQAPGIGRALTELITTGAYQSIDISNMAVERVLGKRLDRALCSLIKFHKKFDIFLLMLMAFENF